MSARFQIARTGLETAVDRGDNEGVLDLPRRLSEEAHDLHSPGADHGNPIGLTLARELPLQGHMARPLRIQAANLTYHLTARGTRRMEIYCDDDDRRKFLELLSRAVGLHDLVCHAYCLMPNHYHLVITTLSANLSRSVQQLNSSYGQWWDRRNNHTGHVFQSRFAAQVIQDESYLLTACRYVVLNPVRAGLVDTPAKWRWSSFLATAGLATVPSCLQPGTLLRHFGGQDAASSTRRYQAFVGAPAEEIPRLPEGAVLGDADFTAQFAEWCRSATREVSWRARPAPPPLGVLFAGAVTRAARNECANRAHTLGYASVEIARYLDLHPSTVSKMIARGARCQT